MSIWNGSQSGHYRRAFALALLLSGGGLAQATDLAVTGNLSVSGSGVIQGESLQLGLTNGTSMPGLIFTYDAGGDKIGLSAATSATAWIWQYDNSGTYEPQMGLDATNKLTLYDRAATPNAAIVLNPSGTSTITQSLTVNGTDNQLPNQTLTGAHSILTVGLADARYVSSANLVTSGTNSSTLVIGGGSVGQVNNNVAIGYNSNVQYGAGVAVGVGASAGGNQAVAVGYNAHAAGGAVALGEDASATGSLSIAIGILSTASGANAVALGNGWATGSYSFATGLGTHAAGPEQFVIGQYNLPEGTTGLPTDDLFEIGNGGPQVVPVSAASNAFAVRRNGDTSVFGANFNFGLISGQPPGAPGSTGATFNYTDGTAGTVTFSAVKDASTWNWQDNAGATTKPQMSLSGANVLTLYNSSGAAAIVLDPANPTAFTGISQTAADARYASNAIFSGTTSYSTYTVSIAGGAASGPDATAIGYGAQATSQAASLGYGANASGSESAATAANAHASGIWSTASGISATASATSATASAYDASASGMNSTANATYAVASNMGATASAYAAVASGQYATAAGANSTAAGYAQFVVGQYNDTTTNPSSATAWVATDDLFQIGNGTDATHTSNAFTVKKNGDTTVNGALTATGTLTAATLVVQHIDPQGDIDMGIFH